MIIHNADMVNMPQAAGQANVAREITIEVTRPESEAEQEQKVRGADRTEEADRAGGTGDDEERRLEALARRESQRENVIARSEDGDTLQVERQLADIKDEDIGEVVMRQGQMISQQIPPETQGEAEDEEDFAVAEAGGALTGQAAAEEAREGTGTQTAAAGDRQAQEAGEAASANDTSAQVNEAQAEMTSETAAEQAGELRTQTLEQLSQAQVESTEAETTAAADEAAQQEGAAAGTPTRETEAATASRTAEQDFQAQTSSNYIGISDDRLEQMYREGEISRQDYEKEIEARKASREKMNEEEERFSKEMNGFERLERQTQQNSDAIRQATSNNASDTLTAKERLDIIEDLQDAKAKDDNRKEEAREVWQSQFQG